MTTEFISTRVNSARLPQYIGKTVRLTGKILSISEDMATVQATDGGHVMIQLSKEARITETFIEVIGSVMNGTTIKMLTCINLGPELDLKLVDDTVELIHDPRFLSKMFT